MKKIILFYILALFLINKSFSQKRSLFFIKMDETMYVKKVKDKNLLYITIQHKKVKVKHLYLFKIDMINKFITSEKGKNGKVLISRKEIYTRGELKRKKPFLLDQELKQIKDLYLIRWKDFDTQNYWRLQYLGSTYIKQLFN